MPNSALLGCRSSRRTISAYSSGLIPSDAISAAENGEVVDIEKPVKTATGNHSAIFWHRFPHELRIQFVNP